MKVDRILTLVAIFCCVGILLYDKFEDSQLPTPAVIDEATPNVQPNQSADSDSLIQNDDSIGDGTIVMYTEDWCKPCRDWKAIEMQKCIDAGWKVKTFPGQPGMALPHYEVYGNGKKIEHTGYLRMSQLRAIVETLNSRR